MNQPKNIFYLRNRIIGLQNINTLCIYINYYNIYGVPYYIYETRGYKIKAYKYIFNAIQYKIFNHFTFYI